MKETKRPRYRITITDLHNTIDGKQVTASYEFDVRAGSNKKDIRLIGQGILFENDWSRNDTVTEIVRI